AVVVVATGAGKRVVGGTEPVVALRRRRRGDPVAIEDAVADLEEIAVALLEVARGIGERLVTVVEDGAVAAEERFARIDPGRAAAAGGQRRDDEPCAARAHRLLTIPSAVA